jgi:hypothetical protein
MEGATVKHKIIEAIEVGIEMSSGLCIASAPFTTNVPEYCM